MFGILTKTLAATIGLGFISGQICGEPNMVLQYGALGLCGLMIWQNNADRKVMVKTLQQQQANFDAMLKETLETIRKCKK